MVFSIIIAGNGFSVPNAFVIFDIQFFANIKTLFSKDKFNPLKTGFSFKEKRLAARDG